MRFDTWTRVRKLVTTATLAGLLLSPLPVWAGARKSKPASKSDSTGEVGSTSGCSNAGAEATTADGDRKLGTAVNWMGTPDAAAHAAVDQGKLVFMIQVSGNFARQEFT